LVLQKPSKQEVRWDKYKWGVCNGYFADDNHHSCWLFGLSTTLNSPKVSFDNSSTNTFNREHHQPLLDLLLRNKEGLYPISWSCDNLYVKLQLHVAHQYTNQERTSDGFWKHFRLSSKGGWIKLYKILSLKRFKKGFKQNKHFQESQLSMV